MTKCATMKPKLLFLALVLMSLYAAYSQIQLYIAQSCYTTVGLSKASPDNSKIAVLFDYKCNIETGYATQISIFERGKEEFDSQGNVLSSYNGEVRGHWLGPYAEFEWESDDLLVVRTFEEQPISLAKGNVLETQIKHEKLAFKRE